MGQHEEYEQMGIASTRPCDRAENKVTPEIHTCGFPSLLVSVISDFLPPGVCVNPKYQATGVSFPQPYQCSGNTF